MPRPESPLAEGDGPVLEFARQLRRLREQAGGPGYRELARRAHYSATTLSEAAAGRRLPTQAVAVAYATACGADPGEWAARWQRAATQAGPPAPDPTVATSEDGEDGEQRPYRGLAPYGPDDAAGFFGRDRLIAEIVARLAERRFLAVFGSSGVGKSSLLQAGVLPAVQDGALTGGHPAMVVSMTPGTDPLGELAVRLAQPAGAAPGPVLDDLTAGPERADLLVRQALAGTPPPAELVLVVDQFEEVFTAGRDPARRRAFVTALLAIAQSAATRARVVLGVRADFYGACAEFPDLVTALRDAQVLVGAMSAAELREAITRPAERASLMVEGTLVSTVAAELADRPGALPLASHALLEAWRRRRGSAITLAGYTAAGGVQGALAQTAERCYAQLTAAEQEAARNLLLRLVEISLDGQVTRRRVRRDELDTGSPAGAAALAQLTAARLLTAGQDTVEVAHEALFDAWPRIQGWIDDDRAGLRLHRQLTESAAVWESLDREPGALYRGIRLSDTARWAATEPGRLSRPEREFIDASLAARGRDRRAGRRRVRLALTGLSAAVIAVSVLAGLALVQAGRAHAERDLARSQQVLAEARAQLSRDPELALQLARRAYQLRSTAGAAAVLRQAAAESRVVAVLTEGSPVRGVTFRPDGRHVASVQDNQVVVREWVTGRQVARMDGEENGGDSVAFSPDGRRLATVRTRWLNGEPGYGVSVWTVGEPGPARAADLPDVPVSHVAFAPGGHRVIIATADATVWEWESTGAPRPVLAGGERPATAIALGPDQTRVAVGGPDGAVRIRGLAGTGPVAVLSGRRSPVEAVALSADGRRVAVGNADGVTIWDVTSMGNASERVSHSHDGPVTAVAFSPDGHRIATASIDQIVRIWDNHASGLPLELRGHHSRITAVEFSPDGQLLASASEDRTVRIWDTAGRADPLLQPAATGSPELAALSPNGRYVATAQASGTVRVSGMLPGDREDTIHHGHVDPVRLAVSDDGGTAASAGPDGSIRVSATGAGTATRTVWCRTDLPNQFPTVARPPSAVPVPHLAVSPHGRHVAAQCVTSGGKTTVQVWDTAVSQPPTVLAGDRGPVGFGADGNRLASVDYLNRVRVTGIPSGDLLKRLAGVPAQVTHAAFSRDGGQLAAASLDGTIRIWDTHTGGELAVLPGHPGTTHVAFSPDGRELASTGSDGRLRIWRTTSGSQPVVLAPYAAPYAKVAFAGPLPRLVTVHTDGTVRTWPCEVCGPIDRVLDRAASRSTHGRPATGPPAAGATRPPPGR